MRSFSIFGSLVSLLALAACGGGPKEPTLASWPETIPRSVVVANVRVLDVVEGVLGDPVDVLIVESKVVAIEPVGGLPRDLPEDALRIEGEGATLLPGLIDMHGHVSTGTGPPWEFTAPATPALNLRSFAYSRVTTVFDPADASEDAFARRARVASREWLGPQIFSTGPLVTVPGGHPVAMVDALVPRWLRWLVP